MVWVRAVEWVRVRASVRFWVRVRVMFSLMRRFRLRLWVFCYD